MRTRNIAAIAIALAATPAAMRGIEVSVLADDQPAGRLHSNDMTTTSVPDATPSPPTANPATYKASNSFTANWSRVTGATGYRLDVSRNSSFSTYVTGYQNRDVGNATSRGVTGLNANTTYYYRVRAYNGTGTSGNSNVVHLMTLSPTGPPMVITNPATYIASFSARLNGSVDPHGLATNVYFQWGTTTAYGHNTPTQSKGASNTYQNVAVNITGLTASTLYHFRMVATNSGGMRFGLDRTFTTLSATGPPVVITNPATNVTGSSATLNGSVDPHGLPTTVHFRWGTTTAYGQATADQNKTGNTYQNVRANMSNLTPNTTYHFLIAAANSSGTPVGIDRTFRTLPSSTATPTPTHAPSTATPTATPTPSPTATATASATPSPSPCVGQYNIAQIGGNIVAGTADIGNHGDDVVTQIALPFPVTLYDQTFTQVGVDSNGKARFPDDISDRNNICLPPTGYTYRIYPYWDDLRTDANTGCSAYPGGNCGIYTSVTGTAPNRVFNIEWRAVYYNNNSQLANCELRLYEGPSRFDVIYGTVDQGNTSATAGVQRDVAFSTEYFCNGVGGAATGGQSYTYQGCGAPTPTPSASPTCTPGFRVLIAYADTNVPAQLQAEILAEPGVTACDLFNAQTGTPTLAQLQQYNIVVPYSNFPFADADTLGNNLADYVDRGGIVVQYGFSHYGPAQPEGVNGRWASASYNPYTYSTNLEFNPFTLGSFNAAHPLMAGVTMLNSNFANIVTLAAGATQVAANNLGESLVAFRPVGAHTTVGVSAYVGSDSMQSGDWGKVIVNAGSWLITPPCATPTPTAIARGD